jgi:subtilisin family serine protease
MQRVAWKLLAVILLTLGIPRGASAGELDWSNVHRPGQPAVEGQLEYDRLVLHFEPGQVPSVSRGKSGRPVTGQLELDAAIERFGIDRFERLFPPVSASRKAAQPPERERVFVLEFDGDRHALAEVAAALRAIPSVREVEPDAILRQHAVVPDDPRFDDQTWLRNTTLGGGDIRALATWYQHQGDPDVVIAIIDSGVDWQHPDLGGTAANDYRDGVIWTNTAELNGADGVDDDGNGFIDDTRGWDFVNGVTGLQNPPQDTDDPDNDPMDYDGHGTAVAGCASAINDNGIGIAGPSWGCSVMAVRMGFTNTDGDGVSNTTFAAQAFDYARLSGADVINMSYSSYAAGAFPTALNMAIAADIVVVVSAGNENTSDTSASSGNYAPARNDVLGVASVNSNDAKATFSNYGDWVDISAPGVAIVTTAFARAATGEDRHVYTSTQGTSFSAPIVAGAAGLLRSVDPELSQAQVRAALKAAVDDLNAKNPLFVNRLGTGRLNMAKMFPKPDKWMVPEVLPLLVDGINIAEPGDEVAVAASYALTQQVRLPAKGITIAGGYDDTFTSRDPVNTPTVIDVTGSGQPAVANSTGVIGNDTVLDGFQITGGRATFQGFQPGDGYFGGGVMITGNAAPTLRNCRIVGNLAGQSTDPGGGGGIAILDASPVLEDVEITGNSGSQGAGVYVYRGSPVFRRVNVHDNVSYGPGFEVDPKGGGMFLLAETPGTSNIVLEDCVISGHQVEGPGGGLYAANVDLSISQTTVENNEANASGGGIYFKDGAYVSLDNVIVDNAVTPGAFRSGGGVHVSGPSSFSDSGSEYRGNSCDFAGGGLYLEQTSAPSISQSVFAGNSAGVLGSGLYLASVTQTVFAGNTVVDNTGAAQGGNGFVQAGGDGTLSNNILAFNGGGGVSLADGAACAGATLDFECNLTFANDAGSYGGCADPVGAGGNVEGDPLFCDQAMGDYRVLADSPAQAPHSGGCGLIGALEPCEQVPVQLTLRAEQSGPDVVLRWRTASERDVLGYRVRRARPGAGFEAVGPRLPLRDEGVYEYRDVAPGTGTFVYRIAEIGLDGVIAAEHGQIEIQVLDDAPGRTVLAANVPNPFNPRTKIHFELAHAGAVDVAVFDARGRRVRTLWAQRLAPAGPSAVTWDGTSDDGRPVASGIYFAQLVTEGRVLWRKMALLR